MHNIIRAAMVRDLELFASGKQTAKMKVSQVNETTYQVKGLWNMSGYDGVAMFGSAFLALVKKFFAIP